MDNTSTDASSLSESDFSADEMADFSAQEPKKVKKAAVEKAQKFRAYAGEKATAIRQEAGVKLKQGAEKAKEFHVSAEDYIKENPTKSVLGAMGLGVIIGLILRR